MNPELLKKALEKVQNPNVLVNMVSKRVRQLVAGNGGSGRPMVADSEKLGAADIALREIVEEKMGFDMPEVLVLRRPTQNGKRPSGWVRAHTQNNQGE